MILAATMLVVAAYAAFWRAAGEIVRTADGRIAGFRIETANLIVERPNADPVTAQHLTLRAAWPDGAALLPDRHNPGGAR